MTNIRGRYFISYRRSPGRPNGTQEAVIMRDALRDRGAPAWRDIDDLTSKPTEDEIVATINDHDTAGAVMLVAPEVAKSAMIRKVEAPRIFERYRADNNFLVKPVLMGLDYTKANDVLNAPAGFQDLSDWNLHQLNASSLAESDANAVARSIVKSRLRLIAEDDGGMPLNVTLFSRRSGGPGPYDLCHDFSPYFNGRVPRDTNVYRRLESALQDTASALSSTYNGISMLGRGNATLPLGVLYGAVFSPLAGFKVSWLQGLDGREETWSLSHRRSEISLKVEIIKTDPDSEDIVLAMSILANIQTAVVEFMNYSGLRPRASIHTTLKTGPVPQGTPLSPGEGLSIVLQVVQAVRDLKDELGLRRARLHIFLACPLAMAILLGQKLNTLSECILYEHCAAEEPPYRQVHIFNPSNLTK